MSANIGKVNGRRILHILVITSGRSSTDITPLIKLEGPLQLYNSMVGYFLKTTAEYWGVSICIAYVVGRKIYFATTRLSQMFIQISHTEEYIKIHINRQSSKEEDAEKRALFLNIGIG